MMRKTVRFFAHVFFFILVLGVGLWAIGAIWFHMQERGLIVGLWVAIAAILAILALRFQKRILSWALLAVFLGVMIGWYQTIKPRQDRDWDPDVSRGVIAKLDGTTVELDNLRDFIWTSETTATEQWTKTKVDLAQLETLDMFTSTWGDPDIAHLLVSFGFSDGQHIVFSVEIRRELGEKFNQIGGFFRQFELVLIGATESDIIRLRTNFRKETVKMFPIELDAEQRKTMFLSYVDLAQRLQDAPEFYNTLTANCTTVVYQLARRLKSDLPLDRRLLLSGNLPEYLAELGVNGDPATIADRKNKAAINPLAEKAPIGAGFSSAIRAH